MVECPCYLLPGNLKNLRNCYTKKREIIKERQSLCTSWVTEKRNRTPGRHVHETMEDENGMTIGKDRELYSERIDGEKRAGEIVEEQHMLY